MSPLIHLALAAIDAAPHATDWDLSWRAGYAFEPEAGVSSQRFGTGPTLGVTLRSHVRLEAAALWSNGQEVRAANAAMTYVAEASSLRATGGVAWEIGRGLAHLRTGVRGGALYVDGYTRVGTSRARDRALFGMFGPSLVGFLRFGRIEVGVDAEAFFLPRWVGAPIFGAYGFVGTTL